ncbi:GTP-binding protein [Streptomyces sp. NPDC059063]|uniref:GTP-binding protein n=1 Tax=unclassified Streptomyces TaxID=2593676 RepID=UPI0036CFB147
MNAQQYKVVLVGDGEVGKTTYVKALLSGGEFESQYVPTDAAAVYPLKLTTSHGDIVLNVWDSAGQEKYAGLRDALYIGAQGILFMFDVTRSVTYKNIPSWHRDAERVALNAPGVLVANKIDVADREVKTGNVQFHRMKNLNYTEISVKDGTHLVAPLLHLARTLTAKEELVITAVNERAVPAAWLPAAGDVTQHVPVDDDDEL